MTRAEIEASDKEMLVCADVSKVLGVNTYTLHETAIDEPERLAFPVMVFKRQVRIPRIPFMRAMGWIL